MAIKYTSAAGDLKAFPSERGLEMATGSAIWHVDFFDVIVNDGQRLAVAGDGHVRMHDQYGFTTATAANVVFDADGYLGRSTSSRKIKTDIEYNMDPVLALQFKPVSFRAKADGAKHFGFIAEDMEDIDTRFADSAPGELPGLDINAIVAAMSATLIQQQKEIAELKKKSSPWSATLIQQQKEIAELKKKSRPWWRRLFGG